MIIKDFLIKQMLKIEVLSDLPGRLRLKLVHHKNIPQEAYVYMQSITEAIAMLEGIQTSQFNAAIGTLLITYDAKKLSSKNILKWLETLIKVGLEQAELIKQLGQTDRTYLEMHIKKILQTHLEEMRG